MKLLGARLNDASIQRIEEAIPDPSSVEEITHIVVKELNKNASASASVVRAHRVRAGLLRLCVGLAAMRDNSNFGQQRYVYASRAKQIALKIPATSDDGVNDHEFQRTVNTVVRQLNEAISPSAAIQKEADADHDWYHHVSEKIKGLESQLKVSNQ